MCPGKQGMLHSKLRANEGGGGGPRNDRNGGRGRGIAVNKATKRQSLTTMLKNVSLFREFRGPTEQHKQRNRPLEKKGGEGEVTYRQIRKFLGLFMYNSAL